MKGEKRTQKWKNVHILKKYILTLFYFYFIAYLSFISADKYPHESPPPYINAVGWEWSVCE